MSTRAPTFDDIDASTHNLSQLLDTIVDSLMNVTYPASAGDLTRVASLSIIARDMSVAMLGDIESALAASEIEQHKAGKVTA
jgi:hypothetical protein